MAGKIMKYILDLVMVITFPVWFSVVLAFVTGRTMLFLVEYAIYRSKIRRQERNEDYGA